MNTLFSALISVALSVLAQFVLKFGMSSLSVKEILSQPVSIKSALLILTNHFVISGLMIYALGAIVWLGVLSRWDVSKAYPLMGLGFGLTVVIGFLLGEQVTLSRIIGVILICAGVYFISRS